MHIINFIICRIVISQLQKKKKKISKKQKSRKEQPKILHLQRNQDQSKQFTEMPLPNRLQQCEPFVIHTILTPTQDSSFILNLISSYNKKLQQQHPDFMRQFKQKQQKLTRHKEQLKLLDEMKEDEKLMNEVLQEIQMKQYEKEYQKALAGEEKNSERRRLIKFSSSEGKQNNRTFHATHGFKRSEQSMSKNSERNKSTFHNVASQKKFRSSVIKSSSFSNIRKAMSPLQNQTNIQSIRNSQQGTFIQESLIKAFNFYEGKISGLVYSKKQIKRPVSKMKREKNEQIILKRKNISSLCPEWIRKNQASESNIINKRRIYQNSVQDGENEALRVEDMHSQQNQLQEGSGEQKHKQINHLMKQELLVKNKEPKQIIPSISQTQNHSNNPYHISNFIKQLNSFQYRAHSSKLSNTAKSKRKQSQ